MGNIGIKLFFAVLLVFFLSSSGRFYSTDGHYMYGLTRSIVDRGTIDISAEPGKQYSKYGPAQSIAAVPLYAASRVVAPLFSRFVPDRERIDRFFLGQFNVIVSAVLVVIVAWGAMQFGAGAGGAAVTALVFAFGTMIWPYAKYDFSGPLRSMWFVLVIIFSYRAMSRGKVRDAFYSGVFMGLYILTWYASAILAPVFGLCMVTAREGRYRRAAAYAAPILVAVCAAMYYNYIRFGDVLETGYQMGVDNQQFQPFAASWAAALLECFYGIVFSGGKSIFVYSPPLLLAIAGLGLFVKKYRMTAICTGASFLLCIIMLSRVSFWGGGMAWGPRYFLPFSGAGMLMAAPFIDRAVRGGAGWRRWLLTTVFIAGLLVQGLAVTVRFNTAYENGAVDKCVHQMFENLRGSATEMDAMCRNPIIKEYEVLLMRAPRMMNLLADVFRGRISPADRRKEHEHTYLDFWPAYILPGMPPKPAMLLAFFYCISWMAAAGLIVSVLRGAVRARDAADPGADTRRSGAPEPGRNAESG